MDVALYQYLDLMGQPLPLAVPCEGRRWIVEDGARRLTRSAAPRPR